MKRECEVIGWVLAEDDKAHVLVREDDGNISALPAMERDAVLSHFAVQTGRFRRAPIMEPETERKPGRSKKAISDLR